MTETINEVNIRRKIFKNSLVVSDIEITLKDRNMDVEKLLFFADPHIYKVAKVLG